MDVDLETGGLLSMQGRGEPGGQHVLQETAARG
jgi:hypothetical protein